MNSYTGSNISVIVVNFNAGAFLGLCIDRIRKSTIALELIVVDNNSKDISKISALGRNSEPTEKYIQNDQNLGFSAAVNIGATAASGEILVVINPDCLVSPHTIDRLCRFLNDEQEVGLVGGLVFGIHGREQSGCRRYDVTPIRSIGKILRKLLPFKNLPTIDRIHEPIPQSCIDVDAVSGSFFAVRKGLYNELGGLDEDYFLHFEDLDLCRRVRGAGYRVVFNPDVSVVHVGGVSSGVKSVEIVRYKHRSLKIYFRKHLSRYSLTVRGISIISQLYVWIRWVYEFINPEKRYNNRLDRIEGILDATNAVDVFVTGEQCQLLWSVVIRLAARGYSVVVETTDPQTAPKLPQVSWVTSEYRSKVSEKDYPVFAWSLCLGSAEQLIDYKRDFVHHNFGTQLLVEIGVGGDVVKQRSTVENALIKDISVDWLQRTSLCLQLQACNRDQEGTLYLFTIKELKYIQDQIIEDELGTHNQQLVHVDDISELCLDVLFGFGVGAPDENSQLILKDTIDRFNQRIRPLYN